MTTRPADPDTDTPGSTGERTAPSATESNALPLDVVFDILKNRRRRFVIRYLVGEEAETTLSDLAEHIAAVENDKSVQALSSDERKRVYVCLYQSHLPKMDDAGIIEFESDRGKVEIGDETEQLTQYIDVDADDGGRDWPRYYLGLAGAGLAALLGQHLLLPQAVFTGLLIGVLLGLFVNLALEHALQHGILRAGVPGVDPDAVASS